MQRSFTHSSQSNWCTHHTNTHPYIWLAYSILNASMKAQASSAPPLSVSERQATSTTEPDWFGGSFCTVGLFNFSSKMYDSGASITKQAATAAPFQIFSPTTVLFVKLYQNIIRSTSSSNTIEEENPTSASAMLFFIILLFHLSSTATTCTTFGFWWWCTIDPVATTTTTTAGRTNCIIPVAAVATSTTCKTIAVTSTVHHQYNCRKRRPSQRSEEFEFVNYSCLRTASQSSSSSPSSFGWMKTIPDITVW